MKTKLFENLGGNNFKLNTEAGIPDIPAEKVPAISGIRPDEENLRLVQKVLLQSAKTIEKASKK